MARTGITRVTYPVISQLFRRSPDKSLNQQTERNQKGDPSGFDTHHTPVWEDLPKSVCLLGPIT